MPGYTADDLALLSEEFSGTKCSLAKSGREVRLSDLLLWATTRIIKLERDLEDAHAAIDRVIESVNKNHSSGR